MERISGYARAVLALLAGFTLFCAGWYVSRLSFSQPWQVTAQRNPAGETVQAREENGPESLLPGERIDINEADVYDLQRLPGIGEKRARDIAAFREEHGPFRSVDDLQAVPGIGPGILEGLRDYAQAG